MTPEFLAAVIDTLLPGDDALPSGTRAGVALATQGGVHESVLTAISVQAGGSDAFARATEDTRVSALRQVERADPDAFRAFVAGVLSDYYESAPVLAALGWRTDAPQPQGHVIAAMDGPTAERLDRVARRGPLWRS